MSFQVGDVVRVFSLPNSEWRGLRGVIVDIIEHTRDGAVRTQECAVKFPGERRCWFLAEHLVKSVPEKSVRFFRAEVLERWKQLNADEVEILSGDRDELIGFLQERYCFTARRAGAEVDEFLREFRSKLERASMVSTERKTASGTPNLAPGKTDIAAA